MHMIAFALSPKNQNQMTVGQMMEFLNEIDARGAAVVVNGDQYARVENLSNYDACYSELAFVCAGFGDPYRSVHELLHALDTTVGAGEKVHRYNGGDYVMTTNTRVWIETYRGAADGLRVVNMSYDEAANEVSLVTESVEEEY